MIDDVKEIIPSQPEWLKERTIFLTRYGSHAYGTSTPSSDLDVRGVAIPPRDYILGFSKTFEQSISSTPVDLCIYGLQKFMNLAADCNPSIIEVLWVDDSDILLETSLGKKLRDHKQLFLSQKAKHTFSGYALSQLKRIRAHRRWLLSPLKSPPSRSEFSLPERRVMSVDQQGAAFARIQQLLDSWELDLSDLDDARRIHITTQIARVVEEKTTDDFRQAGKLLGFDDNLMDYLEREKRYQTASREWDNFQNWKTNRNKARAELEAKMGYDGKHASHLVRLLKMCREILEGKGVIVKRPNAEELLEIRNGAWTYDQLVEFAETEDKALYEVMKQSPLPRTPPRDQLDRLCVDLIEQFLV